MDIVIPSAGSIGVFAVAATLLLLTPGPAVLYVVARSVGAGYLIYMGVRRILMQNGTPASPLKLPSRSLGRLYRDGFIVNVLNPKTALFFLAFLPQFVDPARGAVPMQIAFLGLLFTLMGMTSDALYALVAGTAASCRSL